MTAETQTKDSFKQQLHPELLSVLAARKPPTEAMRIDGWKPSLIGRMVELFAAKRPR
jgi:hypothetical protein